MHTSGFRSGLGAVALAAGLMATPLLAQAGPTQTTTIRAPVTSIAIGPSHAIVDINPAQRSRSHTSVTLTAPVLAIATPLSDAHITIGPGLSNQLIAVP